MAPCGKVGCAAPEPASAPEGPAQGTSRKVTGSSSVRGSWPAMDVKATCALPLKRGAVGDPWEFFLLNWLELGEQKLNRTCGSWQWGGDRI